MVNTTSNDETQKHTLLPLLNHLRNAGAAYLRSLVYEELQTKISQFEKLDLDAFSEDEILEKFMYVLTPNMRLTNVGFFSSLRIYHIENHRFLRLRKLEDSRPNKQVILKDISYDHQAWEPPADKARLGRFNKDGEPLLYVLTEQVVEEQQHILFNEARIHPGDCYAFITYRANERLDLINLFTPYDHSDLKHHQDDTKKAVLIDRFIARLLKRDSEDASDTVYKLTNTILKRLFSLPGDSWDGWMYPSVMSNGAVNIALLPDKAKAKLEIESIVVTQSYETRNEISDHCPLFAHLGEYHADGSFKYLDLTIPTNRLHAETVMSVFKQRAIDNDLRVQ